MGRLHSPIVLICLPGSCFCEQFVYSVPINNVPPRLNIFWALIFILEVIGVFPDIKAEDGFSSMLDDSLHERVILIGSRSNLKFAVIVDD